MSINTTLNYSPNFDKKKRKFKQIKFIIFHYTGMKNEKDAIKRLTENKSKVSSHYFIKNNGEIINLVPDLYVSWHAGVSSWKNYSSINKYSIGIEISNPGHSNNYKKYTKKQINSILKLSHFLKKKYKIKSKFILGHSDISPNRKKDPGEKFPWKYLAKSKIGIWYNLPKKYLKFEDIEVSKKNKRLFNLYLKQIGYCLINKKGKNSKSVIKAFQRRFRSKIINGKIDNECLEIAKNLIKRGLN